MAKKKNKRRKQGLFSKAVNIALILLGFSRPLAILAASSANIPGAVRQIIDESTFGLSEGSFSLEKGFPMYAPVGGAIALGTLKRYLMRKFPVR